MISTTIYEIKHRIKPGHKTRNQEQQRLVLYLLPPPKHHTSLFTTILAQKHSQNPQMIRETQPSPQVKMSPNSALEPFLSSHFPFLLSTLSYISIDDRAKKKNNPKTKNELPNIILHHNKIQLFHRWTHSSARMMPYTLY